MDPSFGDLEAIVRKKICGVCSDRTMDGECGLEQPSTCALFALFPQVASAIQSTQSNDIQDYIQAIRAGDPEAAADVGAKDEGADLAGA